MVTETKTQCRRRAKKGRRLRGVGQSGGWSRWSRRAGKKWRGGDQSVLGCRGCLAGLPAVGQPGIELADRRVGQVHQQLRQVEFGVDLMALAGAGEARKDRRGLAAALIANHQEALRRVGTAST